MQTHPAAASARPTVCKQDLAEVKAEAASMRLPRTWRKLPAVPPWMEACPMGDSAGPPAPPALLPRLKKLLKPPPFAPKKPDLRAHMQGIILSLASHWR